MSVADLAKLIDAGGTLAVSVVALVILMRLGRFVERLAGASAILVERTRGLRVVKHPRGVTVTLDPPIGDEDEDEKLPKA